MPEILRTRDVVLFKKADHFQVAIDPIMSQNGWPGGQGVMWAASLRDDFMVTYSDGMAAGFLLWGSDEVSDRFTSMSGNQAHYRFGVMCFGGTIISTSTYEKYTYLSRVGGGILVPINYQVNDHLLFSLRGYWTNEDEWLLSGDPRGPLADGFFGVEGAVIQAPSSSNNQHLTIQVI